MRHAIGAGARRRSRSATRGSVAASSVPSSDAALAREPEGVEAPSADAPFASVTSAFVSVRCAADAGARRRRQTLDNSRIRAEPVKEMPEKTTDNAARAAGARVDVALPARAARRGSGCRSTVAAPDVDETPLPARRRRPPRCAWPRRRRAPWRRGYADALVIGSDQVADCDGRAVGKPGDRADALGAAARAVRADRRLPHRRRAASTRRAAAASSALVDVASTFRALADAEIDAYLDARAALRLRRRRCKSEALGIALFERIESDDPTALIGLPLIALTDMLRAEGRRCSHARATIRRAVTS